MLENPHVVLVHPAVQVPDCCVFRGECTGFNYLTCLFCDWQEKKKQLPALPRPTLNASPVQLVILAVCLTLLPVQRVVLMGPEGLMLRGLETVHVPHAILQLLWQQWMGGIHCAILLPPLGFM